MSLHGLFLSLGRDSSDPSDPSEGSESHGHSSHMLKHHLRQALVDITNSTLIKIVIKVGWSRGAVSCQAALLCANRCDTLQASVRNALKGGHSLHPPMMMTY